MDRGPTSVVAGVGGAAILAAVLSIGGKPVSAPSFVQQTGGSAKSASTSPTAQIAPNRDGPWYAVCREYATYKFDDAPGERLTSGYVEVRTPDAADAEATEITQVVKGVNEKIEVKKYLKAWLSSCIPTAAKSAVKVMIATVPDPDETEMRLQFDRDVNAIEEGAEARGYHYTSFWFPWRLQSWDKDDKDAELEQEALRRQEPGVLVFRKDSGERLFAFLVGETPTSGVNRVQMALALRYSGDLYTPPASSTPTFSTATKTAATPTSSIATAGTAAKKIAADAARNLGPDAPCIKGPVEIAGPHFSASFLSLKDVLNDVVFTKECAGPAGSSGPQAMVQVIAPDASSDGLIANFREMCGASAPNCALLPLAISEAAKERAALAYLDTLGYQRWQIAHLVEDESAFGDCSGAFVEAKESKRKKDGCGRDVGGFGLLLSFPRELSSLRSVSDKQNEAVARSVQKLLPMSTSEDTVKFSPDEPGERDRPVSYSPEEESAEVSDSLATTVKLMHDNKIRAVLLSATNPLDRLLLLEYLHNQLPDIRVVVTEAEELETSKPHFVDMAGTLSVSSFPALPELLTINHQQVAHRSFAESGQEGEFTATVLLLDENWSKDPKRLKAAYRAVEDGLAAHSYPISVVGENGFRMLPFSLGGGTSNGEAAGREDRSPQMLFRVLISNDDKKNSSDIAIGVDEADTPPRAFYVFALLIFGLALIHFALLFYSEKEEAPSWSYPRRSVEPMEWKRIYFLWVVSNQVFLLSLLLARLSSAALGAFGNPGALRLVTPAAWVLTACCAGVPLFLLVRAVTLAASTWEACRVERQRLISSIVSTGIFVVWSVWLVATWDFGSNQTYVERFLQIGDGLSPVVPFASIVFAYALWGLIQLRRVNWEASRNADLAVGTTLPKELKTQNDELLLKIEGINNAHGLSLVPMGILVIVFIFQNLWEGTRSFETPAFHWWFLIWGIAMLLMTVILAFFQIYSVWEELKKLLSSLELTPIWVAFEKLGLDGLVDLKIWDLAKPQRLFLVHALTIESLEHILGSASPAVEEARSGVNTIVEAEASGTQATAAQSKRLNAKLNVAMEQACKELEGDGSAEGEWLRRYLALRLIAFIRYALLQMRNLLYFVVYGYMLAAISVMFYPFQGRKSLGELLSLVFVVLLIGVGAMLVGIQRNSMLSRIEKGSGEGSSYVQIAMHLLSVGGVPALALLASQFPAVAQFAFSWLRPVLGVLH